MYLVRVFVTDEQIGNSDLEIDDKYSISSVRLSDEISEDKKDSIVTVGTFDGFHLGHRQILELLVSKGNQLNFRKVIVTFEPHPRIVLKNGGRKEIKLLTTIEEKIALFEQLGVDTIYIVNFNKDFAKTSSENFIKNYLVDKVRLKFLIIGYDHTFGKNREGNIETVRILSEKYKFKFLKVDEFRINNEIVSSTVIRNMILNYNIEKASIFLGRNYSIKGKVVYGEKRGKTLGFPTANIEVSNKDKLIPPDGVYAVKVFVNKKEYLGMMNIGMRPTVNNEIENKYLEVHILDFNKDIYNEIITIEFIKFIRNEKKFDSVKKLIEQLKSDKKTTELLKQ